jgi:predicted SnoaL-like aldol condensation-catalyzing enzyme
VFGQFFQSPYFDVSIKRVVADGYLIAIHSHYHLANDKGLAVVDIFRVLKGKVVEHWDVVQAVPETSANDNTMF